MKNILILLLTIISFNVTADQGPALLAEHTIHVYFAPPESQGVYRFQIFDDGTVVKVDNKNNKQVLAHIAQEKITKIREHIEKIESEELLKPNQPACADAPSIHVEAYKASRQKLVVWKRVACVDHSPKDSHANVVANFVKNLQSALN